MIDARAFPPRESASGVKRKAPAASRSLPPHPHLKILREKVLVGLIEVASLQPASALYRRLGRLLALAALSTATVLCLATSNVSFAGDYTGVSNGHGPALVSTLLIDPSSTATLYAGTAVGGLFKSTDGGGSWAAINTGLTATSILSLATDPSSPATLYAGASGGVFKSINGGQSWTPVNTGLTRRGYINLTTYALAIDHSTPATIYAGTFQGVFRSSSGGATWIATPLAGHVLALAIDPSTPGTLYAAAGTVFKTTDAGDSWTSISSGLSGDVTALTIDPLEAATVYAGGSAGVFKTTDGGATWVSLSRGPGFFPTAEIRALTIDPVMPSTVYVSTSCCGIFKSGDRGESWTLINDGIPRSSAMPLAAPVPVSILAIDPAVPTTLYAGTSVGVFRCSNGGESWAAVSTGLANKPISVLTTDPFSPTTLYAGTDGGGIFKSENSGQDWVPIGAGIIEGCPIRGGCTYVQAVAADPSTPSTLYAGTDGGVFKSINGGQTWMVTNSGLTGPACPVPFGCRYANSLAIDPSVPTTLYVGMVDGGGIFKSTNAGQSWVPASLGLTDPNIVALAVDPAHSATIYAVSNGGSIFKSGDGGQRWEHIETGGYAYTLVVDPFIPDTLYAGVRYSGILKSSDGGRTWSSTFGGAGVYSPTATSVTALAIEPSAPSAVYAGTVGGVLKSSDAGANWLAITAGLPGIYVSTLALTPSRGRSGVPTIYAGLGVPAVGVAFRSGVFMCSNGGYSWTATGTGSTCMRCPRVVQPR